MTAATRTTDPRTRRTVARLRVALGELMRTRTLSQITVAELCRTAGVHRTTFYKHYESVADFSRAAFASLLSEVTVGAAGPGEPESYRTSVIRVLEHVAANRESYRRLLGTDGDLAFQRALGDHLVELARTAVGPSDGTGDAGVPASVLGFAGLGLVEAWAMGDAQDAVAAADAYLALVSGWVAAG